jgi:tetratricopeptide (TPR) repeat protein
MIQTCRLVLVLALLLAAPVTAEAQSPKERARVLFREANKLYSRGMYLDALQKYRDARALYPSFKIDLNIGATLDALGRRTEAAAFIERFLVQSASAPAEIIDAARSRLEELRKKLGRVRVTSLVEGATLWVDGKAVGTTPFELPVYLEPGRHAFKLERAGHEPVSRDLDLGAGEQATLDLTPRPRARAPSSQPAATRPVEQPTAPDPTLEARRRSRTLWAYGALGAGAALAVTAAVLYGVGASQGSEAHESYRAATDPDEIEQRYQDVEAAQTKLVVGHVLIGAAVAAVGASVYLFLTRPGGGSEAPRVSLSIGPGSLGILGRF